MAITRAKSGLYGAWRTFGEENFREQRRALLDGDFAKLGELAEASALTMHATAIAAGIIYFDATTLALYAAVRALRAQGTPVFATMDAGPHVKVLVSNSDVAAVRDALAVVPGVVRILTATPGQGARVTAREELPA
jgi:diphosphomevalonate decarboxylase